MSEYDKKLLRDVSEEWYEKILISKLQDEKVDDEEIFV